MTDRLAAVVLAAGAARRFGAPKMLADYDGAPLLLRPVRAACDAGITTVAVVVRAAVEREARRAVGELARVVVVADAEADAGGQSLSLRAGIAAVSPPCAPADGVVVLLGDMPLVDDALVRALARRWREGRPVAVVTRYADGTAPPCLLDNRTLPYALALAGDAGARDLLRAYGPGVARIPCAGSRRADVDTPADLEALRAGLLTRES